MRLGHRRLGTSVAFVDAPTGEVILNVGLDADGHFLIRFRLYDSGGCPAAESGGISPFPDGVKIHSRDGELLLDVPAELDANIRYRLYNRGGELLTCSDGVCTKIEPCLHMEGWPRQRAASTSPIGTRPDQAHVITASGLNGAAA
jgi:hypothetical protein